jgi:hypothetical protein
MANLSEREQRVMLITAVEIARYLLNGVENQLRHQGYTLFESPEHVDNEVCNITRDLVAMLDNQDWDALLKNKVVSEVYAAMSDISDNRVLN